MIEYSIEFLSFLEWMYITDWRLDAIIRMDKLTGGKEQTIVREGQTNRLYGVKIYSEKEQAMLPFHPCSVNNGDCHKMCFAIPPPHKMSNPKDDIGLKVKYAFFVINPCNFVNIISLYINICRSSFFLLYKQQLKVM